MIAADSARRVGAASAGRKLEVLGPANMRTPPVGDTTSSLVEPCCAAKPLHGELLELRKRNIGNDSNLTSMTIQNPTPESSRSVQKDSALPNDSRTMDGSRRQSSVAGCLDFESVGTRVKGNYTIQRDIWEQTGSGLVEIIASKGEEGKKRGGEDGGGQDEGRGDSELWPAGNRRSGRAVHGKFAPVPQLLCFSLKHAWHAGTTWLEHRLGYIFGHPGMYRPTLGRREC